MRPPTLATLLAVLTLPAAGNNGETWNRFRGPDGAGRAAAGHAYPAKLDPDHNLLWRTPIEPGHSSPCVVGSRVFVTGYTEDEDQDKGELSTLCLDRATGELLWRRTHPVDAFERHQDVNSPASASPTSDGERVFVYYGSLALVAYDLEGSELWRRTFEPARNVFGTAVSPVVAEGLLVLVRDTHDASFLEAMDPSSGETVWRVDRSAFKSGWSTPGVRRRGDVIELLVYGAWWVTAYDLADGSERWSLPGLTDEPCTTPVSDGDLVFVTSYNMNSNPEVIGLPTFEEILAELDADGSGAIDATEAAANQSVLSRFDADGEGDHPLSLFFRFLDEDKDGAIEAEEWPKLAKWLAQYQHANALLAVRPEGEDGPQIVWQHGRGVPECPSPVIHDGRVYMIKNGGILSCLDARTGELHYEQRIDSRGPHYASLVAGDGKLYSASARGVVNVIAAGDELAVLSHTDLGERIMATPALVDGVVYLRTDEALYAFGADG